MEAYILTVVYEPERGKRLDSIRTLIAFSRDEISDFIINNPDYSLQFFRIEKLSDFKPQNI